MSREYEAVLTCACGYKEKLSDKEYERIIKEDNMKAPKCGHSKYFTKITAKHKVNCKDWRYGYASTE